MVGYVANRLHRAMPKANMAPLKVALASMLHDGNLRERRRGSINLVDKVRKPKPIKRGIQHQIAAFHVSLPFVEIRRDSTQ